jgi:hypothetical protein
MLRSSCSRVPAATRRLVCTGTVRLSALPSLRRARTVQGEGRLPSFPPTSRALQTCAPGPDARRRYCAAVKAAVGAGRRQAQRHKRRRNMARGLSTLAPSTIVAVCDVLDRTSTVGQAPWAAAPSTPVAAASQQVTLLYAPSRQHDTLRSERPRRALRMHLPGERERQRRTATAHPA